jgi:hypothetical protein
MRARTPLFEAWKVAEQDAKFAEYRLQQALTHHPVDPTVEHDRVVELNDKRQSAHVLFGSAMRELGDAAEALRPRGMKY